MPKKKEVVVEEPEEEEVTCPVCGKPVGIDVASCPYCGAEFEEEEAVKQEEPVRAAAPAVQEEEEETAECPVCGKMVSLSVSTCPNCGAEFEEEEVEEVIEVEEKKVPQVSRQVETEHVARKIPQEEVLAEEAEIEAETVELEGPSSILDPRVIGISLIVLGIIGSQIAFMIDWYWSWVPPIKSNLGMFIAIPAVIIVVGLLVFLLIKKAVADGKRVPKPMPGMMLSVFLFGILALVLVMLWNPINKALQSSSAGVGAAFVILLVVGAFMMFFGTKMGTRASAS